MMSDEIDRAGQESEPEQKGESHPLTVVDTRKLFGDSREICIEHQGERYRLRITRKGRLILSK